MNLSSGLEEVAGVFWPVVQVRSLSLFGNKCRGLERLRRRCLACLGWWSRHATGGWGGFLAVRLYPSLLQHWGKGVYVRK